MITTTVQMRKPLAEGYVAAESWNVNPGRPAPKYMPITTIQHSWRGSKRQSHIGAVRCLLPQLLRNLVFGLLRP